MYHGTTMMKNVITNDNGTYLFGDLDKGTYNINFQRNDNHGNGVSTADIVKIQRHILGIENLNSPYKLIAADVNATSSITASDISEIRRLVLGVVNEFNKVESWSFVPKAYVFPNVNSPWSAPRSADVSITKDNERLVEDFVAIDE